MNTKKTEFFNLNLSFEERDIKQLAVSNRWIVSKKLESVLKTEPKLKEFKEFKPKNGNCR